MPNVSGIEWLAGADGAKGLTCNPVIGCERCSPGCGGGYIRGPEGETGGCWAEELVSTRMSKNPRLPMYADLARPGGGWSGVVKLVPERLGEIVTLGRSAIGRRVFVCDLSDLFHRAVTFEYIAAVFGAMACAPKHLFYILTKRADRASDWAEWIDSHDHRIGALFDHLAAHFPGLKVSSIPSITSYPLENVAFGVTVEDRRYGVPRLDLLRQIPARWRWASVEPQLKDLDGVSFDGVDLVVNGGESGDRARPFDLAWARNVRDAARKAGARYFMKQGGDSVHDRSALVWTPGANVNQWVLRGRDAQLVGLVRMDGHWSVFDDRQGNLDGPPEESVEKTKALVESTAIARWLHRIDCGKKGNDLARLPEDLRIRENLPMPARAA